MFSNTSDSSTYLVSLVASGRSIVRCCLLAIAISCLTISSAHSASDEKDPDILTLVQVISGSNSESSRALRQLDRSWDDAFVLPLIEILRLNADNRVEQKIVELLEKRTGKSYGREVSRWFRWLWLNKVELIENYPEFKSWLYGNLDPKFKGYFSSEFETTIRLDEVRWGGVVQDGIPPLRNPDMISASEAKYLEDDHVIFAIEINGDYRAYPKRIMGWHEMFVDAVGGVEIVGVYCTLCGAMIIYESQINGVLHKMGTSGFLYRSNKLMYDEATQSLWNTFWGRPVIGPLVGKGIVLEQRSVVTTTWGEWRDRHPDTTVLSIDTGYKFDYKEGAAYREYYSTDKLMFNVPKLDKRLKNKAEILGISLDNHPDEPVAFSAKYLLKHQLLYEQIGETKILILTDNSGANRVYEGHIEFTDWDRELGLIDKNGQHWTVQESQLLSAEGQQLERLPAHRAFWFGWYSAYNNTRLVH